MTTEEMLAISDFATAVRIARQWMGATVDEENDGTLLLFDCPENRARLR